MEKHTEKQPIDDLFARKLGNISLPPSPDGFARLQARMGQGNLEKRVVFWRNPDVQRYMAVAACLLMVCLFGWLYMSGEESVTGEATVAVNKSVPTAVHKSDQKQARDNSNSEVAASEPAPKQKPSNPANPEINGSSSVRQGETQSDEQLNDKRHYAAVNHNVRKGKTVSEERLNTKAPESTEQILKTQPNEPASMPTPETQVAKAIDRATPVAERVLVVTIVEPEALVAARQAIKVPTENAAIAVTEKPEKENKSANLWQQVKRLKQGEVFARKDVGEDERGLLGRAYSGLKQTLDKDKSVKQ